MSVILCGVCVVRVGVEILRSKITFVLASKLLF